LAFLAFPTALLTVLLAIDVLFASRPNVALPWLALQLMLSAGSVVVVFSGRRLSLGIFALSMLALMMDAQSVLFRLASALWGVSLSLSVIAKPPRRTGLAVGATLATLGLAPELLDGITPSPLLPVARLRLQGPSLRALPSPFVDQRLGVQLWVGEGALADAETIVIPEQDVRIAYGELAPGTMFDRAGETALQELKRRGLVTIRSTQVGSRPERFDAASTITFDALTGRALVRGTLLVGVTGDQTTWIAAWSRVHRSERTAERVSHIVRSFRRLQPRQPIFSPQARQVAERAVIGVGGSHTGVRVVNGAKAAVLLSAQLVDHPSVEITTSVGSTVLSLENAHRVETALVVPSPLVAEAAPLRAFATAPVGTPFWVYTGAWQPGWVQGNQGAIRDAETLSPVVGPAFDGSGALVGFYDGLEAHLITLDAIHGSLTRTLGAVQLTAAPSESPPSRFTAVPNDESTDQLEVPERVAESFAFFRTPSSLGIGVVVRKEAGRWVVAAERSLVPADAQSVNVRLGSNGVVRAGDVVRVSSRLALVSLPVDPLDGFTPITLDARGEEGARFQAGLRIDPMSQEPVLKWLRGSLSRSSFQPEPGPSVSLGPLLTSEGRFTGLLASNRTAVISAETVVDFPVAQIKDAVWVISAEASGTCQLVATVELEDPLDAATLVRVRVAKGGISNRRSAQRLTTATFTDAVPKAKMATLRHTFPCFLGPAQMQFEVMSLEATRFVAPQTVATLTDLPQEIRGRSGPSEAGLKPSLMLSLGLWETPEPTTDHPCAVQPALCERSCAIEDYRACAPDGRYAMGSGEYGRAIGALDIACGRGDLEGCLLLLWAVADHKSIKTTAHPEDMVKAWCQSGLQRACWALTPARWKQEIAPARNQCQKNARACGAYGWLLWQGPRIEKDTKAALQAFKNACSAGDDASCGAFARFGLQLGKLEVVQAARLFQKACDAKDATACIEAARDPGLGITVPRSPQAADAQLAKACSLGAAQACEMVPATPP
jgi:hypothetical protein